MKQLTRSVITRFAAAAILSALALAGAGIALAQQYPETLSSGMRWRPLGPLRAGRASTRACAPEGDWRAPRRRRSRRSAAW